MAVDKGMLTPAVVRDICRAQRADAGLFGDIAVRERRLTRKSLDELLFFQKVHHTYLGEALLHLGHISEEQYRRLLEHYWALRDAGKVSLRYLHDFFAENRLLDSLVGALSLAVRRFAGEPPGSARHRPGLRSGGFPGPGPVVGPAARRPALRGRGLPVRRPGRPAGSGPGRGRDPGDQGVFHGHEPLRPRPVARGRGARDRGTPAPGARDRGPGRGPHPRPARRPPSGEAGLVLWLAEAGA